MLRRREDKVREYIALLENDNQIVHRPGFVMYINMFMRITATVGSWYRQLDIIISRPFLLYSIELNE